jgi:signal peptidase II
VQAARGAALTIEESVDIEGVETRPAAPARYTRRALAFLGGTAAVVVGVDLLAKQLVLARLTDHAPVRVLGGLFYLDVTRNSGAAFSLGTGHTWVFPLVTIVVVGWIGWLALRLRSVPWAVVLGLVLGGALGNLGDRIFRAPGFLTGHVVDFISVFGPNGDHWPIFNLADSALTCGVVLAVILELTGKRRDGAPAQRRDAPVDHGDGRVEHGDARVEHGDARVEHHDARVEHGDGRVERRDG